MLDLKKLKMVRTRGFEPPHLLALPPQGSVSTVPPRTHKIINLAGESSC